MPSLIKCRSCKHKVKNNTKTCPSCGIYKFAKEDKKDMIGCMSILGLCIIILVLLNFCTDSETESKVYPSSTKSQKKDINTNYHRNVVKLNDENLGYHLSDLTNDYTESLEDLMNGYERTNHNTSESFIQWRKNEWIAKLNKKIAKYDVILEQNQKYINDSKDLDLVKVFSSLKHLKLISHDLLRSIEEGNPQYLLEAQKIVQEDMLLLEALIKEYDTVE